MESDYHERLDLLITHAVTVVKQILFLVRLCLQLVKLNEEADLFRLLKTFFTVRNSGYETGSYQLK